MGAHKTDTATLRNAIEQRFIVAGRSRNLEYKQFVRLCERNGWPVVEAYPGGQSVIVRNLPASFDPMAMAQLRSIAAQFGRNARFDIQPELIRISHLVRGEVLRFTEQLTDWLTARFGLDWRFDYPELEAAEVTAEAILEEEPDYPGLLADFLERFEFPKAGIQAAKLLNEYTQFCGPNIPPLSQRLLAGMLVERGMSKRRKEAGIFWYPGNLETRPSAPMAESF